MAPRGGGASCEKVSILLPALLEALRSEGCLSGVEACRVLFKLDRIPPGTTRLLLEAALQGDRRFLLLQDDSVSLNPKPDSFPGPLEGAVFTVLDLETTGGSAASDRILEVGAVRVERGRAVEEFSTLVNPGIPIPPFIASMTGIREAMLADAPRFPDIAPDFLSFLGDSILVAHNLPFDLGFLNRELARHCGWVVSNPALCTVRLGRRLLAHLPDRRLDTVADHYGIIIDNRHRALGDARATARILIHLLAELAERGIQTLDHVEAFLAEGKGKKEIKKLTATRPPKPPPRSSPSSVGS